MIRFGFDRLVKKVDELANEGVIEDVFIQAGFSRYEPKHCKFKRFIEMEKFEELIRRSDLVISHGGAGTIICALEHNKPTIVVPRLKRFQEHVNDHQLDLVRTLEEEGRIIAIYDVDDLREGVKRAKMFEPKTSKAEPKILEIINDYIQKTFATGCR
jgi:UDP-N-acetylglucosamine transferase subunit ALG13